MNFKEALAFWNGLISDIEKHAKKKVQFKSVQTPVLASGAIAGFFLGMGYGYFYLDVTSAILFSILGAVLGVPVWFFALVMINSFYFLTSMVFGSTTQDTASFFGPQSLVHSFFSMIFSAIFALSGILSILSNTAAMLFFLVAILLFSAYYVYVNSHVLCFQTGFTKLKSTLICMVIPVTSIALYVLIRSLYFLASVD